VQAHTSVLTLVEVASVASRLYQVQLESKKNRKSTTMQTLDEQLLQKEDDRRKVFVIKTLQRLASLNLIFVQISGETSFFVPGIETSLPAIFDEAILISLLAPLRTFDLMHIAAARHAKQSDNRLGALVTGDTEFIRKKQELSKIIGMPILSPREYVQALGLS
jgi:predicted nucleic acid-binding protein